MLSLGESVIQYCIKFQLGYIKLTEITDIFCVDYSKLDEKYNQRDINERIKMKKLVILIKIKLPVCLAHCLRGDNYGIFCKTDHYELKEGKVL